MTFKNDFIRYIHEGGDKPFVSLQIGAGAGFDTKLAGKTWNSETTFEDTIRAYEIVGGYPLLNICSITSRWKMSRRLQTQPNGITIHAVFLRNT